jgi:hypothetical protein
VDLQYTTHIDQSAVDFFSREAAQMAVRGKQLVLLVNARQRQFLNTMGLSGQVKLESLQDSGSSAIY